MSIVNQMLQDLEQRRTATAGQSPLGGLSASDTVSRSSLPINNILLGTVLVLAVATAFLFGSQRSAPLPILVQSNSDSAQTITARLKETPLADQKVTEVTVASSLDSTQSVKTELLESKPFVAKIVANKVKAVSSQTETVQEIKQTEDIAITEVVSTKVASSVGNISSPKKIVLLEQADVEVETSTPVVISKRVRPLSSMQLAQKSFQQAVSQLGRGEQGKAHDTLVKALSIDPSHLRVRETLAALLLNTGRVSEAGAVLQDGLRINPAATVLAKLYARILVDQGNASESIAVLERALPSVTSDPDYYALLAAFYQRAGKHGQAAQTYQQVLRVRPGVASWWMGLGLSFESIEEPAQALSAYQRAWRVGGLSVEVQKFVAGRVKVLTPAVPSLAEAGDSFGS